MARSFKLPDLGEGIHEGEVIAVLVSVGEEVKEGDPILEVETDKASVEIPSPYSGKVVEIRAKAGDVVKVGDVLMTFSDSEEEEGQPKTGRQMPEKVPSKLAEQPQSDGEEITADDPPKRTPGPVPASPATRRLARELKVDLHSVPATGPGGLVTAEDVRSFAGQAQAATPEDVEDKAVKPSGELPVPEPSAVLPDFSKWGPVDSAALAIDPQGDRPADGAGLVADSPCVQPG